MAGKGYEAQKNELEIDVHPPIGHVYNENSDSSVALGAPIFQTNPCGGSANLRFGRPEVPNSPG